MQRALGLLQVILELEPVLRPELEAVLLPALVHLPGLISWWRSFQGRVAARASTSAAHVAQAS